MQDLQGAASQKKVFFMLRFVVYSILCKRSKTIRKKQFVCSPGLYEGLVSFSYQIELPYFGRICCVHLPEGGERRRLHSTACIQVIRMSILVFTADNIDVVTCVDWAELANVQDENTV
jgi:hypothetical protein